MATRMTRVDPQQAARITERICKALNGEPRTAAEVALLMAYCEVAEGVRDFPAPTRRVRASIVVNRATYALCALIEEVAAMTDEQVLMARPSLGPETSN